LETALGRKNNMKAKTAKQQKKAKPAAQLKDLEAKRKVVGGAATRQLSSFTVTFDRPVDP